MRILIKSAHNEKWLQVDNNTTRLPRESILSQLQQRYFAYTQYDTLSLREVGTTSWQNEVSLESVASLENKSKPKFL